MEVASDVMRKQRSKKSWNTRWSILPLHIQDNPKETEKYKNPHYPEFLSASTTRWRCKHSHTDLVTSSTKFTWKSLQKNRKFWPRVVSKQKLTCYAYTSHFYRYTFVYAYMYTDRVAFIFCISERWEESVER